MFISIKLSNTNQRRNNEWLPLFWPLLSHLHNLPTVELLILFPANTVIMVIPLKQNLLHD